MIHNTQGTEEGAKKKGVRIKDEENIKILIGLGNPDPDLLNTYHNAGMLALPFFADALAPDDPAPLAFRRYKDSFEYASKGGFTFVKPLTFMNDSGRAVKDALRVLKMSPAEMAVVHDDSDLALGEWKIARGGGAAGHKGILSIVAHLKTEDFVRIRIGIRDPHELRRKKAGDFVLSSVTPRDREMLEAMFKTVAAKLPPLLIGTRSPRAGTS